MIPCYPEGSLFFMEKFVANLLQDPVEKAIIERENDLTEKIRPKKEDIV